MALVFEVSSFFVVFLFLSISLVYSHHLCHPDESFALVEFKKAFQELSAYPEDTCDEFVGQASYRLSTWNESRDCCSWDGVQCDEEGEGHVVGLDLSCSYLYGTLHPNNTLFTLSHLQTLNLSSNYFASSPIPPQFGMLTNLRALDLSSSYFQGHVPLELSRLSKLVSLHLSGNFLSFSSLVMNQLVHNLTHIRDFALSRTDLSDIRPTSFMNFSLSLTSLRLSWCSLTGNFPDHILGLPSLRVLQLDYNNELKGHLPISNWSKSLEILDLSSTDFTGGIPSSIGEAKALTILDLSFSNFNGEISDFQIHSNPFFGQLPNCPFNLTQKATASVCSDNRLPNLIHLNLGHNSFIGAIPSWLYESPRLKSLHLFQNRFSSFMGDFRSNSLESLDLCFNNLQGEISESIYRQVNLTYLRLCHNNFSGVLNLDMLLRIPGLTTLHVSYNSQLSIFSTNVTFPNLVSIGMSSLKLEKFPYSLRYQKNLSYLELSNNQIREIPKWISELGALSFLDLSNNFLSSGITEVLLALPNLKRFFLDFNLFDKLPIPMLLPSMLEYFSISNNQLSGNVHPSICQATQLQFLDLTNNSLSGAVPSCLFNMNHLQFLLLKSNNFSGVIPVPPSISYYLASKNYFTGEIPPSICLVPNLVILSLSNNRLHGTIPPCLANVASLLALDLKSNNFSGTVPTKFSKTSQLRSLDLKNNQIEGELPRSLLNCKNLQILDLGDNKITGNFPHWLESAPYLRVLILRSNRFYGHINNSMDQHSFPNLRIIDLSHNHFSGPLPSNLFQNLRAMKEVELLPESYYIYFEWFIVGSSSNYDDSLVVTLKGFDQTLEKVKRTFKAIDLSSNDFSGEIPKSIGILVFLKGLDLSHNKLTGEIPASFGNLTNLEWLDLSSNELMGNIPSQLTALTFLSFLNLSQNQLSGPIPQGKQFATFGNSSYIGNIGLCDFPLPKCDAEKNHESQLVHEEEDDSLGKGFWLRVVFMGYGCGMVFGIFVGYLVFRVGKPVWIVAMVEGKTRKKNYRPTKRHH